MKTYHALNFRIVSKYHDLFFLGPFLDSIWLGGLFLCKQSSIDSVIGYHRVYKLCDKPCRQGFAYTLHKLTYYWQFIVQWRSFDKKLMKCAKTVDKHDRPSLHFPPNFWKKLPLRLSSRLETLQITQKKTRLLSPGTFYKVVTFGFTFPVKCV